jgi:hypothetical protein
MTTRHISLRHHVKTGRRITERIYKRKVVHQTNTKTNNIYVPLLLGVIIGASFGSNKPKFDYGKISGWLV